MRESYELPSHYPSVSDWWNQSVAPSGGSLQEYLLEPAALEAPQRQSQVHVVQEEVMDEAHTIPRLEALTQLSLSTESRIG